MAERLEVVHETDVDPSAVQSRSVALLRLVQRGEHPSLLRLAVPRPTVAFGRRDTRLPGYDAARAAALAAGFEPVVRSVGGRAAAFHEGTLIVDHLEREADAMRGQQARFVRFGERFVRVLTDLGVEAAMGELPGEYCPGAHSVHGLPIHAGGARVKLVGTAQRVVAGAWLFSSVVVLQGAARLRAVTTDVYAELGLPLDPATVGAADDLRVQGTAPLTPSLVAGAIERAWSAAGPTG